MITLFLIIIGMGAGSFATTALYRLPRGELWLGERPNCNLCGHRLYLKDFMPIFSYFTHQGTCRYCGGAYQMEGAYFLTELLITMAVVGNYWLLGLGDLYLIVTLLMLTLIVMAIADYLYGKIHPKLLLSFILLAALYRTYHEHSIMDWIWDGALLFMLAAFCRYYYFTHQGEPAIGQDFITFSPENRFQGPLFDRVLLAMALGIWLGIPYAVAVLCASLLLKAMIRRLPLGCMVLVLAAGVYYAQ